MENIDWDRIDKWKFLKHGIGMFSAVTGLLFPLSVIKTRQMASHGVSGGLDGMKDTVKTIWKSEGVPGFYRGFSTVIFGTLPARMVYLTSLEMVKSGVTKASRQMDLSPALESGLANFAGGAVASLSVQLVLVPIDVVSQRQMVHGADTLRRPQPSTGGGVHSSAAATATAATSTAAQAGAPVHAMPAGQQPIQQPAAQPAVGSTGTRAYGTHVSSAQQQGHRLISHWHVHHRALLQSAAAQAQEHWRHAQVARQSTAALSSPRLGGVQIAREIIREEGVIGLYRGFGMSLATFVPSSAIWWAAYGVYQHFVSSAYIQLTSSQPSHTSHSQQQLLSSSKIHNQHSPTHLSNTDGSSSSSVADRSGVIGDDGHRMLVGKEVVGVQMTSSVLAGATASLLTNPLDLIKTRIQVAVKSQQHVHTVRGVLEEILREDGPSGLLRGVLPRMVNSALWGSCMVMVYEWLKRISVKEEEQIATA